MIHVAGVAIIGEGQTVFGEHWEKSLRDLIYEAGVSAMADASTESEIDALFIGNMSAGRFSGQEHLGALAADALGLGHIPATRLEAACASGSVAFRQAYYAIKSGNINVAVVIGAEKMTELHTPGILTSLAAAGDQEWEASVGLTFAGAYALMAMRHMYEYGTTREQLAHVSVINHKNAVNNKYAQYRKPVTPEQVMSSSVIAYPLCLFDCSPITDGAAAVILASEEVAKRTKAPVWVLGTGQGSDTLALHDRASITSLAATKEAVKGVFSGSGKNISDVDVLEVHDCFSINEIMALEDLGFCSKGDGGKLVLSGAIEKDGHIPTNTTGGLKAVGHPVGATGIRQICDLIRQLRGVSCNQVSGARTGLSLNIGGSGATAVANLLGV